MAGAVKRPGAVLRNTLMLVGSQVVGIPLSVVLNAVTGRYLGAADFGYLYLAGTLCGFGFLFVEWGHGGVVAAAIARDPSRAGRMLGSTILWRTSASLFVGVVLFVISQLLGYATEFRSVLLLAILVGFVTALKNAYQDATRGFERLDVSAYAQVASQLGNVLLVIPVLVLGGQVHAVLLANIVCALLVTVGVRRAWLAIGKQPTMNDRAAHKQLFSEGSSFLLFGFVMALQPNIDAIFLSKLTSPAVLGWQAAAQRLQGVIIMPVAALAGALYPTLSRLYVEDRAEYGVTARRALQGTALLAIPAALCCALYRAMGVRLFGHQSFEHVEQNLLVLSSLVFLLYFSMPVGVAILAAGRQRAFAIVQLLCIVSSVVLDPLLIPWFQARYGNGGLGVCVANVTSEIAVIGAALPLLPSGLLNRALAISIGKGVLAGVAMTAVALALGSLTPFVAAPIALATYVGCLWLIGGIEPEHVQAIRGIIERKLGRGAKT